MKCFLVVQIATIMKNTLSVPIPVRFYPDTNERLEDVAARFGLKKSTLIRMAVDKSLEEFAAAEKITITRRRSVAR